MPRSIIIPVAAILLLLFPSSPAQAQDECLDCHGEPGLSAYFGEGEEQDVFVDRDMWSASVHGEMGLGCTDCHVDITEYPHPEIPDATHRDFTLRLYNSCQMCHEEQFERTLDSVHQRALAAGNKRAAVCADCHDPHAQRKITDLDTGELLPAARVEIPQTCATCHEEIQTKYAASVHRSALVNGNPDVPTCIDCHGVHNIGSAHTPEFRIASPRMCADCHTDGERMSQYGLSTDVFRTYVADFHGSTVTLFQRRHPDQTTNKPVCYDCHGIHDIKSATDPEKGLSVKANLLATCQKCHPDATTNFPDAWMSHHIPDRERNPLVYWARVAYAILIPTVVGGMALFVASDLLRRRLETRKRRRNRTDPQ
jgi:hypothetical protein